MHGLGSRDGARSTDWGRTRDDYDRFRPRYPAQVYEALESFGVRARGARICDLGTGTGFLALELARRGASVVCVDLSAVQLASADAAARAERLDARFVAARAEATGLPSGRFDAVTAAQCALYFEHPAVDLEIARLLVPGGRFATVHLSWLPREDAVARASEALVLAFNPDWSAADWSGDVPTVPEWARGRYDLVGTTVFDVDLPFTRESWRGRFRACRGSGASLTEAERAAFDREHAALLERVAPAQFTVRHRADVHVLVPRRSSPCTASN
jgi:SAM-dependent methyltransferase